MSMGQVDTCSRVLMYLGADAEAVSEHPLRGTLASSTGLCWPSGTCSAEAALLAPSASVADLGATVLPTT